MAKNKATGLMPTDIHMRSRKQSVYVITVACRLSCSLMNPNALTDERFTLSPP